LKNEEWELWAGGFSVPSLIFFHSSFFSIHFSFLCKTPTGSIGGYGITAEIPLPVEFAGYEERRALYLAPPRPQTPTDGKK
jgi:hypothetical protein